MAKKAAQKTPVIREAKAELGSLSVSQCKVILAIGFAFTFGFIREWEFLNGAASLTRWEWTYQDLSVAGMGLGLLLPFLAIGTVLWIVETAKAVRYAWPWLGVLAFSNFLLQFLSVAADPRGMDRIRQIVQSSNATGYFTDALTIQNLLEWMGRFHLSAGAAHSSTHPPGPILYYYCFSILGPNAGAYWGGMIVGLLGSMGVILVYHFTALWTQDPKVRLTAAAFYALLPSLTVFFPEFDQAYPLMAMGLLMAWVKAVQDNAHSFRTAFWLGFLLFAALFFAYNLLVLGAFFAFFAVDRLWHGAGFAGLVKTSALALISCSVLYGLLWLLTGYNAPATFMRSLHNQTSHSASLARPYAIFVIHDLYDFALGAGFLAVLIVGIRFRPLLQQWKAGETSALLSLCGIATILTVDFTGLLRGETARVWLFLQPLIIIPAAIELARVAWPWRFGILAMQWWILVCLKAKMSFIEP